MARGSNQQTSSLWFGNHGNFTKHEVDLHKGEHITSVSLRHGAIVDQLSFETSLGRQFTFGGSGGSPFQLDIPEGHRVVAFKGGFGGHIHSIGAVTTPLRPCGDASSWNTALHAVHFDKDFRAIVKTLFIMRTTTVTDETQQLEPKYKDSQWWMLPLEVFEMIVFLFKQSTTARMSRKSLLLNHPLHYLPPLTHIHLHLHGLEASSLQS
ncbi:Jacalin-type lectin domain-containing protein (Fragment), variant 2 [Balamuthia mandrillaris]